MMKYNVYTFIIQQKKIVEEKFHQEIQVFVNLAQRPQMPEIRTQIEKKNPQHFIVYIPYGGRLSNKLSFCI